MGVTIGAAGRRYGKGRVAALTKAVNLENLNAVNEDFFIRMLKNLILWAKSDMYTGNFQGVQYAPRNSVAYLKNGNEQFDERVREVLSSINHSASMLEPWYERGPFSGSSAGNKYGIILIIPSYSALDGTRMRDDTQRQILDDVYNYGTGLVIAEWFHLLDSLPNKRSFTYDDPDSISPIAGLEADDRVAGLIDASPFIPEDNVVFSDADRIVYNVKDLNDDTSFAISPRFQLANFALDTPFDGHISQLGQVKEDVTIFWDTDVPAEATTTSTTTTTTTDIPYEDIKLKVGEFYLENVCGPQKLYLSGQDSDFFIMEGREIFLTKNIEEPVELNFDIVAEDYFENERFNKVVEHMTINLIECDKPITLPKNGSRPQYSYRKPENFNNVWGDNAPSEVISPYEEYSFTGQGLIDKPAVVCLGGKHSDDNVFWMQLNEGGQYTVEFDTDLAITDCVTLFLIENSPESNLHPVQHEDDFDTWRLDEQVIDGATVSRLFDSGTGSYFNPGRFCGQQTTSRTFNIDQPLAVDPENQNILLTGEAYLVFNLRKNLYVTDHTDIGCATITYGTTTTPPPPEYDFVVFIENNSADTEVTSNGTDALTAFKFTSVATTNPGVDRQSFYIKASQPNTVFDQLFISEDSDFITYGIRSGFDGNSSKLIDVYLTEMPTNGGQAVITITGAAVTTTTTEPPPPPPTFPVRVTITDDLGLVYLSTYSQEVEVTEGLNYLYFYWYVNSGFEYRPSIAATSNPYQFYDRPTITQIISQNPPGMVSLPSPTPASGGSGNISVIRGISWNNSNANLQGQISIPIQVPVLGGEIELRMSGQEPVPTTTTTTTTTLPPCDDTIYIICKQVLNCAKNNDGECVPQAGSYQEVVFSTCCPLNDTEVLDIVKSHNGAATTDLNTIYAADCPPTNFELLAPCFATDSFGNCQETIHSEIIDTINCGASQNPLP